MSTFDDPVPAETQCECGNPKGAHWRGRECLQVPPKSPRETISRLERELYSTNHSDRTRAALDALLEMYSECPACGADWEQSGHKSDCFLGAALNRPECKGGAK